MHAEIAAAVARAHTPGLSTAAAARLEELLGRSPSVLELEVYATLLRGHGVELGAEWPLRVELGSGVAAVLTVASGPGAGVEAALGLTAVGTPPLAVVLGLPAESPQVATAERAAADRLGVAVAAVPLEATTEVVGLAVGLVAAQADSQVAALRAPAAGDALVYLGAPTGREGLGGGTAGGFCPPPGETAQSQTMALLRVLQTRPGLVLRARLVGKGGLAQAAAGLAVGSQLLLDEVPRHPVVLHPKELLLAETASRALIVVPAERVAEVLTTAQAQGVAAVAIGVLTAEARLSVLMKPRGATAARPVCELPLRALHRELPQPLSAEPDEPAAALPLATQRPAPASLLPVEPSDPTAAPPLATREPEPANPLLVHLRAHAGTPASPATTLHEGPPALTLAVRDLAPAARRTSLGAADAARRGLSAAASAVRETGATPVGAAWLLGAAVAAPGVPTAPDAALHTAATQLGLTVASAHSEAVPADGLMVVIGQKPAAVGVVARHFAGPGFLVAVLGFDGADTAQEHAAGELCSELIHGGLCATAHAIGQGGLLLALGRACAKGGVGCTAVLPVPVADLSSSAEAGLTVLFQETPGRYLLAIPAHRQADARLLASDRGVPLWPLGRTSGSELVVRRSDGPAPSPFTELLRLPVAALLAALRPD